MADELTATGDQFGTGIGLIYIFNLIVGTGALTMPKAFQEAGWLVSLIVVVLLGFASNLTVTMVTETMAAANAVLRIQNNPAVPVVQAEVDERAPLLGNGCGAAADQTEDRPDDKNGPLSDEAVGHLFDMTKRIEMGKMAEMFFGKYLVKLFYLCIIIYLYGDLSIYVAAVPKSVRDTACTWRPENETDCNKSLSDSQPCWNGSDLNRMDAYRIFVAGFILLLGPFTFLNVQKTKYLQIATTIARWLAFGIMIVLSVIRLAQNKGEGRPPVADISGIPNLFGVCVYSFMCHHSLPSLVTPIRDKSRLYTLLGADYVLILAFYALLSFTGIFTFKTMQDLYTLNFLPDECGDNAATNIKFIQYFLALFPVFTLSTNFPIIAITLRNNLQTLVLKSDEHYQKFVYMLFPLLAIIPPAIVGMVTNQVEILVGITGSYAGAGIQYVFPALLVYFARKHPRLQGFTNNHKSPYGHPVWIIIVLVWAVISTGFVTVNHIITRK